MRELEKSRGYPGKRRELAIAIYLAGPPSQDKKRFRTHLTPLVMREGEGFKASYLESFLTRIHDARGSHDG